MCGLTDSMGLSKDACSNSNWPSSYWSKWFPPWEDRERQGRWQITAEQTFPVKCYNMQIKCAKIKDVPVSISTLKIKTHTKKRKNQQPEQRHQVCVPIFGFMLKAKLQNNRIIHLPRFRQQEFNQMRKKMRSPWKGGGVISNPPAHLFLYER